MIRHHSASSLALFIECARKWWLRYIKQDQQPASEAMLRGSAIHKDLEDYQLGRKSIEQLNYGDLIVPALKYFPKAGTPGVLIEHKFQIPTMDKHLPFLGFIDVIDASNPIMTEVLDTKTTGDFRYVKTPSELAENIQMMAYAWYMYSGFESDIPVDSPLQISHVYIRTKGKPAARKVEAVVTYEQVKDFWHTKILPTVEQIELLMRSGITDAQEAPPNTESCGNYGGCFYKPQCGFEIKQGKTKMSNDDSLLVRLRAARQAYEEGNPAEGSKQLEAAAALPSMREQAAAAEEALDSAAVLPPDAPSRTDEPTVSAEVSAPAAYIVLEETKANRKPKRRSTNLTADIVTPASETSEESTPPPAPSKPWPKPVVFVDCYPVKGSPPATLAESFMAVVTAECAVENKVYDYRAIPYEAKAKLAAALRKYIDVNGLPEVISVSSFSTTYDVFMEVVTPYASLIVKSVRG